MKFEVEKDTLGDALSELADVAWFWSKRVSAGKPAPVLRRALIGAVEDVVWVMNSEMRRFESEVRAGLKEADDPATAWVSDEVAKVRKAERVEEWAARRGAVRNTVLKAGDVVGQSDDAMKEPYPNWAVHTDGPFLPKILQNIDDSVSCSVALIYDNGGRWVSGLDFRFVPWTRIRAWRLLTNPYTGEPRDLQDVDADPAGAAIQKPELVVDPYAEAKAAWRDGELEIFDMYSVSWQLWNGGDEEPIWVLHPNQYRRRPKPEQTATKPTPWYPDNSGQWVEIKHGRQPDELADGDVIERLSQYERDFKNYAQVEIAVKDCLYWERYVAYKLLKKSVKPDPVRAALEVLGRECVGELPGRANGLTAACVGYGSIMVDTAAGMSLGVPGARALIGQLARAILEAERAKCTRTEALKIRPGDKVRPDPLWNQTVGQSRNRLPDVVTVEHIQHAQCQTGVLFGVRTLGGELRMLSAEWFEPCPS